MSEIYSSLVSYMNNFRFEPGDFPLSNIYDAYVIGPLGYLLVLYLLHNFMRSRGAFDLRWGVAIHNAILCVLSFVMFVGLSYSIIKESHGTWYGLWETFCDPNKRVQRSSVAFWLYIFYLSKFYEFLDTIFLVLRKRELSFLHVYHHFIVIPLFWNLQASHSMGHYLLVLTNTFVHVVMYYYFVLSTLGYRVWWKKWVTILQIGQFFFDMLTNWPLLYTEYFNTYNCTSNVWAIWFGQFIGLSFVILFGRLYWRLYPDSKAQKERTQNGKHFEEESDSKTKKE